MFKSIFTLFLVVAGLVFSEESPVQFGLGEAKEVSARSLGLAGSGMAASSDVSALYYNSANLTSVRKREFQMTLDRSRLQINSQARGYEAIPAEQSFTGIRSLAYAHPVPVVRGGLTFAFAWFRPRTFSDLLTYRDSVGEFEYRAEGNMNRFKTGMAVEVSPNAVLGLGMDFIHGTEKLKLFDKWETRYVEEFTGFSLEPSLLLKNESWKWGTSITLLENYNLHHQEQHDYEDVPYSAKFDVNFPIRLRTGLAKLGPYWMLALDLEWIDWRNLEISDVDAPFPYESHYQDEMSLAVGGEMLFPELRTNFRGGYQLKLEPNRDNDYPTHSFSLGAGIWLSGSLMLDAGIMFTFWESTQSNTYQIDGQPIVQQLHQEALKQQGMFTISYRF